MRDEPLAIRREIGLKWDNNRRQDALNALTHDFYWTNEYRGTETSNPQLTTAQSGLLVNFLAADQSRATNPVL